MQQVYPFNLTFLFADIGGSTQLEQLHPQEMPTALARHHELLRHATETHFGYIFQIIGDAFCTTCSTALDGLQAVAHAQRALQIEPWGNNLADLLASIQYPMGNSGTTGEAVEPHLSSADGA